MALNHTMRDVADGDPASASNFNNVVDNVFDLDDRLLGLEAKNSDQSINFQRQERVHDQLDSHLTYMESASPPGQPAGGKWETNNYPADSEGWVNWSYWDTVVEPPVGLRLESDNQRFTVLESGVWNVAGVAMINPYAGGTGYYLEIFNGDGSKAFGKHGGDMRANTVSITRRFYRGEQFYMALWLGPGNPSYVGYHGMVPTISASKVGE